MDGQLPDAPLWFWIIAVLGLLWNLMGVGAFIVDSSANYEHRAERYGQDMAREMASQPKWNWAAYAIAVFTGVIGCIGLLVKAGWAPWVLALSLAAVLIQQLNLWIISDLSQYLKSSDKGLSALIIGAAIGLVIFGFKVAGAGLLH